jgi:hypothetical protein
MLAILRLDRLFYHALVTLLLHMRRCRPSLVGSLMAVLLRNACLNRSPTCERCVAISFRMRYSLSFSLICLVLSSYCLRVRWKAVLSIKLSVDAFPGIPRGPRCNRFGCLIDIVIGLPLSALRIFCLLRATLISLSRLILSGWEHHHGLCEYIWALWGKGFLTWPYSLVAPLIIIRLSLGKLFIHCLH